jgi:hypothetical protein
LLTEVFGSVPGINAVPHEDNLRYFDVSIHGPTQSPYEGRDIPLAPPVESRLTVADRRYIQIGALPARRLPYDSSKNPVLDQDISPEY